MSDDSKLVDIWEAIQQERDYQDRRFDNHSHDIPGWVLIIKKQLDTAVMHWLDGDNSQALTEILQSTAVGIACLEQHGVPDAAFRVGRDSPLRKCVVENREDLPTYQLKDGYIVIDVSKLETKEEQEALMRFMRGQTMPIIPNAGPLVYLHDYDNFLAKGQLFWD